MTTKRVSYFGDVTGQVFRLREGQDPSAGTPLPPRNDLRNHSPCGFAWGYGGSGPAQLSLAMLADYLGSDSEAISLYQDFKFRVIGKLPKDDRWIITDQDIEAAIGELREAKAALGSVQVVRVGRPYFDPTTPLPLQDRCEYTTRAESHVMHIVADDLTEERINELEVGDAEFAVYVHDDVIYFMFRFGTLFDWSDAPYSWWKTDPDRRVVPDEWPANAHMLLSIFIIDTRNILQGMRVCTLSPEVSSLLISATRQQIARGQPNEQEYTRRIEMAYARFPTVKDMLPHALARCRAGD